MASYGDAGLLVQGGPNSGMLLPLSGRPVTVGRRADDDVVIDEITVSRKHVLIMETPSGYVLRDLNTTNGTFLNRVKVGVGEQLLKHGDTIRLAGSQITLIFRHEGSDTQKMGIGAPATGAIRLDSAPAQTPGQPPQPQPVAPMQPPPQPQPAAPMQPPPQPQPAATMLPPPQPPPAAPSEPPPIMPAEPVPPAAKQPQPAGKEAELLRFLESRRGTAVSGEEIARFVWPELPAGAAASQEIARAVELLRAEIEDDPSRPTHLITVGEFGYLLL